MIHGGKCSGCEKVMANILFQPVDLKEPFGTATYRGVSYQCPNCRTVLGAGPDFLALKADIINGVTAQLRS